MAGTLYVCEPVTREIVAVASDGSSVSSLFTASVGPYWPAYFPESGLFFFNNSDVYSIEEDGSNETVLISDAQTNGLDIDFTNEKLYYTAYTGSGSGIRRCNFDGSSDELVLQKLNAARVRVDIDNNKVYWVTQAGGASGTISRDNISGGAEELLVYSSGQIIEQFALDLFNGKMYWVDSTIDSLHRADLDGSNQETLEVIANSMWGCAVDGEEGKIYWSESSPGAVKRSDLDGSNQETITTDINFPAYMWFGPIASSPEVASGLTVRGVNRFTRTNDYDPDIVELFPTDVSGVNIQVWSVGDGQNNQILLDSSGCSKIGFTSGWRWSLSNISGSYYDDGYHYFYRMTADTGYQVSREFVLRVPENGISIHPSIDFLLF